MKTHKTTSAVYSGLPAYAMIGLIAVATLALSAVVHSQTTEWTVYDVSNSPLPSDGIGPLVFDSRGNLWVGTGDMVGGGRGLAKFNGEDWTVYNTSNSGLPGNNILALAFDAQENLWIGTTEPFGSRGGLTKFDGENWTVYTTANSGLPCKNVMSLAFDAQGSLWVGTGDPFSTSSGLAKFDGENWTVYTIRNSGLPYHIVDAIAFDAQENLWIGTVEPVCGSEGGGLARFDGENWTVYNKANSGLTSNDVWDLVFDARGNLWVGHGDDYRPAGGGLAKFDGESWIVYHTSNSPLTWHMVTSLALDAQQNLWMGMCSAHTTTGGVARFDGENWLVLNQKNSGLPHITATGLAFDWQGSTWIGTYGGGLATLRSWPVVDFNSDGVVDSADICIMVDYWGTNEPLCDIGPTPWGDGIVDVEDLKVLVEYLFGDIRSIAHFKFDEVKGNIANDSARNLDGTVYGEPEWRPKEGIIGGALQLDGFDDHIKTGFILNPTYGELSIFAWIKGGSPGQVIVSQVGGANWLCTDTLEGNLMTNLRNPGRFGSPMLSQTNITDGHWHHIGLVWDGSKRILYVDNVAVAEDTQNGLESSDGGLYIGTGKSMEPDSFWSGLIDDVRIYNRAISPWQIEALE